MAPQLSTEKCTSCTDWYKLCFLLIVNLYKNLKKPAVWGLLLKLKWAGPAVCTSKWIRMRFWNFPQRDSVAIPSAQAQRWAVTSLSSLAPSDPLGSVGSLRSAESPLTVLKWSALWIWGSRKSSQASLVHTPCQPRTDVSGVNRVFFYLFWNQPILSALLGLGTLFS